VGGREGSRNEVVMCKIYKLHAKEFEQAMLPLYFLECTNIDMNTYGKHNYGHIYGIGVKNMIK
jgi:hypothetical protein